MFALDVHSCLEFDMISWWIKVDPQLYQQVFKFYYLLKVVFLHECYLLNLSVSPSSKHVLILSLTLIVTYIGVPVLV